MARYTVHVPGFAGSRGRALERSVFVRDGWSWGAFLFGPFWLMAHRHWLTGVLTLIVLVAALAGVHLAPLQGTAKAGIWFLIALLFGLEGASLRRLALARAGYAEEAVVLSPAGEALEQRFFASASDTGAEPAAMPATAPVHRPQGVIGLFPDARKHP